MQRFICSLVGIIALFTCSVWADIIEVQGEVSGQWSADTVIVTDSICVPPGDTLAIDAGVTVLFDGHFKFMVLADAVLSAVGTSTAPIVFDERTSGTGWHGIRFIGCSGDSRLEYCQIRHGLADGSGKDSWGGGVYLLQSSPTITHCLIDSCTAGYGGGICCDTASSPEINHCTITNDSSSANGGAAAIHCNYANPTISENTISNNAVCFRGLGAIGCFHSDPLIVGNEITNNRLTRQYGEGGAIQCLSSSGPAIRDNSIVGNAPHLSGIWCQGGEGGNPDPYITSNTISQNAWAGVRIDVAVSVIFGNTVTANGGPGIDVSTGRAYICANIVSGNARGGISIYYSYPVICNNIVVGNSNSESGGGMDFIYSSADSVFQNTVCFNSTSRYGAAVYSYASRLSMQNCVFYGNVGPVGSGHIYADLNATVSVAYSDVQGGWPGEGNIDADPRFRDPANGDFRLQDSIACMSLGYSPCIDAGNPIAVDSPLSCDWGLELPRSDMGAYGGISVMPTGVSSSCCTCPSLGNLDGSADCLVTMSDLTVLIDNLFLTLTPLMCFQDGDLDNDGLLTMGDLVVLIDNLFVTLSPLPPCP